MSLLAELRGISPLEDSLQRGSALSLLESLGVGQVVRVIRVYSEPEEIVVLWVNAHGGARTTWVSESDAGHIFSHTTQGFK